MDLAYGAGLPLDLFPIHRRGNTCSGRAFLLGISLMVRGTGLVVMPKLSRASLLIIMYLYASEIAPIYLAYSIVRHQ